MLKWWALTRYSRSMVLEEEESTMEEEEGWIEERRQDNERKRIKKRMNGNDRLERHGRCGRKKTKSHFVKFDTIWVYLNVEHVIALVISMKEKVLVDRKTLRNVGTKLG